MSKMKSRKSEEVWCYGIDPGHGGAIALLSSSGEMTTWAFDKLDGCRDLLEIYAIQPTAHVYLEKVGATRNMGSSSAFKFGRNYGIHYASIIAARMVLDEVTPVAWQRPLKLKKIGGGLEEHGTRKKRNMERAVELFPHFKLTQKTCDAALIARYGLIQQGFPI